MQKGNVIFQRSVFEYPHGFRAVPYTWGGGNKVKSLEVTGVSYIENKTLCQFSG